MIGTLSKAFEPSGVTIVLLLAESHVSLHTYPDEGKAFFDAVRQAGLEGMVAKRRDSIYTGVLSEDWLKIKCLPVHDFVIGGWISDDNSQIGALLLQNSESPLIS